MAQRTLQAVIDPTAIFDPDKRYWKLAFFDENGDPATFGSDVDLSTKADLVGGKVPAAQLPDPTPSEVAYAERTSSLTSQTNTGYSDSGIVLPTFTVVTGSPVCVELFWPIVLNGTASKNTFAAITKDDNTVLAEAQFMSAVAFASSPLRVVIPRITTPGTYSLKARHKVDAASGAKLGLITEGQAAFMRATRL